LGIKNAKGDLIITTDGDCAMKENWLMSMVSYYETNDYKLVTGPVLIRPARSPFAWFQQLDVISLIGVTGATIRNNFPTMCNGANLLYSKNIFHEVEGFKGNHDLPTGDDIFLMQKIEAKYPGSIGFAKNYDACVFTMPEKGISGFVSQRVRWLSKSRRFGGFKISAILYFVYLFHLLLLVDVANLFNPMEEMNWLPLAVAGGAKFISDVLFNLPVTLFFRKGVLLLLLPVIEVFYTLYIVLIGAISLTGRYRWKDRSIK
jgi:cellulose synthase/poly-beta-1,6-N-acetylglucosamine synthase-like glycosyltransferase